MLRIVALLALLLTRLIAPTTTQAAAGPGTTPRAVWVVATSFSTIAPRAGQHETVTAQLFLDRPHTKPRYLAGAHLSVTLKIGTIQAAGTVLATIRGTTTNEHGKAFARFTVPARARGRVLWANTTVTYKGQVHRGSNHVSVAK